MELAAINAIEGRTDEALDWLERGYRAGWKDARFLGLDPFFASLRREPRYLALTAGMMQDVAEMRKERPRRILRCSLRRRGQPHDASLTCRVSRLPAATPSSQGAAQAACFDHPSDQNQISSWQGGPMRNPGGPPRST